MTTATDSPLTPSAEAPIKGVGCGELGQPSVVHREAHLTGKPITVVYEIKDPTEWRKTNPLRYAHDGLEAYCVSIGDLAQRRDEMRAALERIADEGDRESRDIARAALDADDSCG